MLVGVASADRDESVFTDADADRFDVRRDAGRHVAFGHGIHHCVGVQLARMELRVALGTLLCRLPGLRLAEPVDFKKGSLARGPQNCW